MTNQGDLPEPLITVSPEYLGGEPIRWQQRLDGRSFAVVLLRARSNKLEQLPPLIPALLQVLDEVKPGDVREIGG